MQSSNRSVKFLAGLILVSFLALQSAAVEKKMARPRAPYPFAPLAPAPAPGQTPTQPQFQPRPGSLVIHLEGPKDTELIIRSGTVQDPATKKPIPTVKDPATKKKVQKLSLPCDFKILTLYAYLVEIKTPSYSNFGKLKAETVTDFTEAAKVNLTLTDQLMEKAKAGDLQIIKVNDPQYQVTILQFSIGNRPF